MFIFILWKFRESTQRPALLVSEAEIKTFVCNFAYHNSNVAEGCGSVKLWRENFSGIKT